jgi:predicted phage-related endonuclease
LEREAAHLAKAQEERARRGVQAVIDNALRERLVAMTADFKQIWTDTSVANRERKRMPAHVIKHAALLKNTRMARPRSNPIQGRTHRNAHDKKT